MIPEYSAADITKWLDGQTSGVEIFTNTAVVVVGLIGFFFFASGILSYMADARNNASQNSGRGGGASPAITKIVIGAALGVADLLFILLLMAFRP